MSENLNQKETEKVYAVGFKGFDPDMKCRDKQYAENTVFEEDYAEICHAGMHFCENPLDVLDHYQLLNNACELNEFATVEALAEPQTEDEKSVTTKLKIGVKLGLKGFIKAAVIFSLEWLKKVDFNARGTAASGYNSKLAASGYNSKLAASGDNSKLAASGDNSKLAASGDNSQLAASGYNSQLAASGEYSKLAASGDNSKLAASGDNSKLAASGDNCLVEATGKECVIAATGINSKVKGAIGCFIACAEWKQDNSGKWYPVSFKTAKVDGKKIKPDTFYILKNGKFVEVKDGE